jgi:hypothetical protein
MPAVFSYDPGRLSFFQYNFFWIIDFILNLVY